jgi:hypothetical protein
VTEKIFIEAEKIFFISENIFFAPANIFSVTEKTVAEAPNVICFLQKEPWQPVFVFAVSALGTPASRRLAHWYAGYSGTNQINHKGTLPYINFPLFGWFIGTTAQSDSSDLFTSVVRRSPFQTALLLFRVQINRRSPGSRA